jgi:hypothetical protein
MQRIFIIGIWLCLAACSNVPGDPGFANHPVDCAMGIRHDDCNPGTAGYANAVAAEEHDIAQCQSYGLQQGTPAYAQCRQNIIAERNANARAAAAALIAMQSRPAPQPQPYYVPVPTQNPVVNCTSNRNGNTVNTSCY